MTDDLLPLHLLFATWKSSTTLPGQGLTPPPHSDHTVLHILQFTNGPFPEWQFLECGLIRPPPRYHISINLEIKLGLQWLYQCLFRFNWY